MIFQNWAEREPDVGYSGQDYGVIANGYRSGSWYYITPGQWDDVGNGSNYFICE